MRVRTPPTSQLMGPCMVSHDQCRRFLTPPPASSFIQAALHPTPAIFLNDMCLCPPAAE